MSMKIYDESVDYQMPEAVHGSHRFSNIVPQNGQSVTMLASSSANSTFELPNSVYSLGKSVIDFEVEIPVLTAACFLHHVGQSMIGQATLQSQAGANLAHIPNCFEYTRAIVLPTTRMEDFLERDSNIGAATDVATDRGANTFRSDNLKAALGTSLANVPNSNRILNNGTNAAGSVNYTGPCYYSAGTAATKRFLKFSVPLSEFKHTMLADKRNLYANSNLRLRIDWSPVQNIGWEAALAAPATDTDLTVSVSLTNVRLRLAVETDPKAIDKLQAAVHSGGITRMVPYVWDNFLAISASTNQSVQYRINSSMGDSLLQVYHAFFHTDTTGMLVDNMDNIGNAKVVDFMTSLNSRNLFENRLLSLDNEDYLQMKDLLKGSVIQSSDEYRYNRVFVDSFRQGKCVDWADKEHIEDGIPLDTDQIWAINATTANAAHRLFTWIVTQRALMITPDGRVGYNIM